MAGKNDPIKMTREQYQKVLAAEKKLEDLEYELDRAVEAGIDVGERRQQMIALREKIKGIKKVYAP